ncbi:hypothetical protein [Streptomyces sp. NPDC059389]|uniref:hypothetical protein n=1 Tax=Streptomyces sp. NPDC059389 TaxID=3346818 RepID=UPI0036C468DF
MTTLPPTCGHVRNSRRQPKTVTAAPAATDTTASPGEGAALPGGSSVASPVPANSSRASVRH